MLVQESPQTTGSLLAIDPGGSGKGETGIVLLEYSSTEPARMVDSWAVPGGLEGFSEWVDREKYLREADIVVCESFVNWGVPGADLTPILIEGVVRFVRRDTVLQGASGKNTAVPDSALENLGLLQVGRGDHHRDRTEAARHGIWFLKMNRHTPTVKVGWPPTQS